MRVRASGCARRQGPWLLSPGVVRSYRGSAHRAQAPGAELVINLRRLKRTQALRVRRSHDRQRVRLAAACAWLVPVAGARQVVHHGVMAVPAIVLPEARSALSRAAGRWAELLRSLPDTRAPILGSRWTVGDAAAHVVMELRTEALVAAGEAVSWAEGATSVPGTPRGAAELRGGPRAVIRFTNGHASLEQPGTAPVDCHILAAPVTLLLVL